MILKQSFGSDELGQNEVLVSLFKHKFNKTLTYLVQVVCSSLVEVEGLEDLEACCQEEALWEVLDQEVDLGTAVNMHKLL
jgi:hypothetical protein